MNIHIGDCIVTLIKSPEHRGLPSIMESFDGQAIKSRLFVKTQEFRITVDNNKSWDKKLLKELMSKPNEIEDKPMQRKISRGILLVAVFHNGNWRWRTHYKENEIVNYSMGMELVNKPMTSMGKSGNNKTDKTDKLGIALERAGLI